MDIEFEQGDYVDAYKVAAGFMNYPARNDEFLLRASLAAALCGEVYNGQREFVEGATQRNNWSRETLEGLKGNSPHALAGLSAIGLGDSMVGRCQFREAEIYYKISLRLDPGNPGACVGLGFAYQQQYEYSLSVAAFKKGLIRSGSGHLHQILISCLESSEQSLRKVGDGNPDPPVDRTNAWTSTAGTIHP